MHESVFLCLKYCCCLLRFYVRRLDAITFHILFIIKDHFLDNSNNNVAAAADTFKESTTEYGNYEGPFLSIATVKSEDDSR